MTAYTLSQNLFLASPDSLIQVRSLSVAQLTTQIALEFLQTTSANGIGIAAAYGTHGILKAFAFSTASHALLVHFPSTGRNKSKSKKSGGGKTLNSFIDDVMSNKDYRKLGFDMDRITTSLYFDHQIRVRQCIDLQSLLATTTERQSRDTLFKVFGGEIKLHRKNILSVFRGNTDDVANNLPLQAWACHHAGTLPEWQGRFQVVRPIDTYKLNDKLLLVVSKLVRDADRLVALKPTTVKNDVETSAVVKSGKIHVTCTRFSTRLRMSYDQKIVVNGGSKGRPLAKIQGQASQVTGRAVTIKANGATSAMTSITSVHTIGREPPTAAEEERTEIILSLLKGRNRILEFPIARTIYLSPSKPSMSTHNLDKLRISSQRPLNPSQTKAVESIISEREARPICLIQGPPGTGKTTVIAAAVTSLIEAGMPEEGVWLAAQSNVAVKNIAEKLADIGFFKFKLLVSKDFHFDWHEHLYEQISHNIIRSDDFSKSLIETSRQLLDARVILCTLSMFSHPKIMEGGYTRLVPVTTVIVDEASQIEIGSYLPLLNKFSTSLKKLAFVGDGSQLAPYGQDDLGDLKSIFEVDHLRRDVVFLDTQYRMPTAIGNFISRHVYKSRLRSNHAIHERSACRLVDVHRGRERKQGVSWVNDEEVKIVVAIVKKYEAAKMQFRIITPYDAQRNKLEKALISAKLPWKDKCFNVDSFQGNEEDHIIISVVRSDKVGFLSNKRRTNVMLSRCKKSMIICTSRMFLKGRASSTLAGKLGKEWEDGWLSSEDILAGRF